MFEFITSFFSGGAEHAQLALRTSGDWLPAAGWFIGISTMLFIAAVLVFFFLKAVGLSIKVALAGAAFMLLGIIAWGYEAKGENNIIPKLNAANARIVADEARAESFRADAAILQAQVAAKTKAAKAATALATKTFQESLRAQDPAVSATRIPAAAGVLVNRDIAAHNAAVFGPGSDGAAQAAAAAAAATTIRDWQEWSGKVTAQYADVAAQAIGLQEYITGLKAAEAKADAAHPQDKPQTEPHR